MKIFSISIVIINLINCNNEKQEVKKKWFSNIIFWRTKNSINCAEMKNSTFYTDLPQSSPSKIEKIEEFTIYSEPFDHVLDNIYAEIISVEDRHLPKYEKIENVINSFSEKNTPLVNETMLNKKTSEDSHTYSNILSNNENSNYKLQAQNKSKSFTSGTRNMKETLNFMCNSNDINFSNSSNNEIGKLTTNKNKAKPSKGQCFNGTEFNDAIKDKSLKKEVSFKLDDDCLDESKVCNKQYSNFLAKKSDRRSKTMENNKLFETQTKTKDEFDLKFSKILSLSQSLNDTTVDLFFSNSNYDNENLFLNCTNKQTIFNNESPEDLNSQEKIYDDFKHKNFGELVKYIKTLSEKKSN